MTSRITDFGPSLNRMNQLSIKETFISLIWVLLLMFMFKNIIFRSRDAECFWALVYFHVQPAKVCKRNLHLSSVMFLHQAAWKEHFRVFLLFLGFCLSFLFCFVLLRKAATFPKSWTEKFMNISVQRKWCAHVRRNCYCVCVCFNAYPDFFFKHICPTS